MFYHFHVPKQAVGANLVYFDVFNAAGSACDIILHSVAPVVSGAVAVTGVLGVDLFLTRTTTVGTGGTAATKEGTDPTAATICQINGSRVLPAEITARLTPSGGGTAGAILGWTCVFTEETGNGTYTPSVDMVCPFTDIPALPVKEGSGFRVVQGAVASVGNIGFNVVFQVTPTIK
jgi:hypothetical protein